MKTTSLLAFLALVTSSVGGPLQPCTEMDVCSSIVFNHMALVEFKDAIARLVNSSTANLLTAAEEMRVTNINLRKNLTQSVVNPKDVEDCQKELDDLVLQKTTLESEPVPQADDGFEAEMTKLRQEKDDLIADNGALEDEIRDLERASALQMEQLMNLTKTTYEALDCADIQAMGNRQSGVYTIHPFGAEKPVEVLCDLDSDGGAWTVFLKRQPQDEPLDFNGPWEDFKVGFGDKSTEFWMGNDLLHEMTSKYPSTLRMDAEDFNGNNKFAKWDTFSVHDADNKYQLTVSGYQNTISTMGDSISESNGAFFTTFDQDNDVKEEFNCATGGTTFPVLGDGAWWYTACGSTRPMAPLLDSNYWNSAFYQQWTAEETELTSLQKISLKFRRSNYEKLAGIDTPSMNVC